MKFHEILSATVLTINTNETSIKTKKHKRWKIKSLERSSAPKDYVCNMIVILVLDWRRPRKQCDAIFATIR